MILDPFQAAVLGIVERICFIITAAALLCSRCARRRLELWREQISCSGARNFEADLLRRSGRGAWNRFVCFAFRAAVIGIVEQICLAAFRIVEYFCYTVRAARLEIVEQIYFTIRVAALEMVQQICSTIQRAALGIVEKIWICSTIRAAALRLKLWSRSARQVEPRRLESWNRSAPQFRLRRSEFCSRSVAQFGPM